MELGLSHMNYVTWLATESIFVPLLCLVLFHLKKKKKRAGEMAQQVRTLTGLLKVMSSNPSNHMVAHNHP